MKVNEIERLLARYYDGETSETEEKEFVLMSQEKNEFTIIAITGNLTLQEIQGIINKE